MHGASLRSDDVGLSDGARWFEGLAGRSKNRAIMRIGLLTTDRAIDVDRLEFEEVTATARLVRGGNDKDAFAPRNASAMRRILDE